MLSVPELRRIGVLLEVNYLPLTKAKEMRKLGPYLLASPCVCAAVIAIPDDGLSRIEHFLRGGCIAFPLLVNPPKHAFEYCPWTAVGIPICIRAAAVWGAGRHAPSHQRG
jgi:hypothetical protein